MEIRFVAKSVEDLDEIAQQIIAVTGSRKKIVFFGEIGVGKTTLIKAICKGLNVQDEVVSPTFSIVNEYNNKIGEKVYHFDFYRLKSELEAYDLGYEDYLYSGNVCLIEWPEKIASLIPEDAVEFHISGMGDKRDIKIVW